MEIDLNVELNVELQSLEPDVHVDNISDELDDDYVESVNSSSLRSEDGVDHTSSSDEDIGSHTDSGCDGPSEPINTSLASVDVNVIASRLAPGSVLESLDQAYVLYCEYARLLGFSVKKGTQAYFPKTAEIRMKVYHCSCEGRTDNKATNMRLPVYRKQHNRSECKARLRVSRDLEGPWKVTTFTVEHNHELLGPDDSYLLRSSRNLTHAKRSILDTFNAAGIGVSQAWRFMKSEVGGPQNLGFTKKDAYDHIDREKRLTKVGNNDADAIMQYLHDKSTSEPYFFWRVMLDDEGRLMNFYFRDCRCADDYASFGDVVSVDTTFRTNKYNLICAPFVGMNHHRQNIMFGIAFLSDETSESFEWLFKTFLESMDEKQPEVIFSDQDQALKNGIDFAFNRVSHRLCQWHINQNAPAHFGSLNGVKEFKKMWYQCMHDCDDEEEFETLWRLMVSKYELENNKWFTNMYELRKKWADVFTKHRFSGGLHATSRSEVTNKVIKDLCAGSTSLAEFVRNYDRIIEDWRTREREEDALCRGMPGQCVDGNRLLRQAARVYTRNVYKIFEREAVNTINVNVIHSNADTLGGDLEFHLNADDSSKTTLVVYNQLADTVSCTCGMLITDRMFCRHILKVFYTLNVGSLPDKYVAKRWTRDAKHRDKRSSTAQESTNGTGVEMVFINSVMREMYDMAVEYKDYSHSREFIKTTLDWLRKELPKNPNVKNNGKKGKKKQSEEQPNCSVLNPPQPNHKWLPPKRRVTVYERSRKNASKQNGKRTRMDMEASSSYIQNFGADQQNGLHNNGSHRRVEEQTILAPAFTVDTMEQSHSGPSKAVVEKTCQYFK